MTTIGTPPLAAMRHRASSLLLLSALLFNNCLAWRGHTVEVSSLNDSGSGSLRSALASPDFHVKINVTGTILLNSELTVSKDVHIDGPGASQLTISGQNTVRVLNITSPSAHVYGVTIANGFTTGDGAGIVHSGSGLPSTGPTATTTASAMAEAS